MKRLLGSILFLVLGFGMALAQDAPPQPDRFEEARGMYGERREQVRERLEAIKMWRLTEALALSEEQSVRFFPRYRTIEEQIHEIHEQIRTKSDELERASRAGEPDSQLEQLMREIQQLERQRMDIKNRFLEDISDVLTVRQRATLMIFEDRFRERMREALQDRIAPPPPMPDGPHDRGGRRR